MALKYKRSFGKAEREQRQLLFKEVKNIRIEIKNYKLTTRKNYLKKRCDCRDTDRNIRCGIDHLHFHTLVLDEAVNVLSHWHGVYFR
jgi:hypothetical protein